MFHLFSEVIIKVNSLSVKKNSLSRPRRFGLYSRRGRAKYKRTQSMLPPLHKEALVRFSWRKNLTAFSGKDPLRCHIYSNEIKPVKLTYADKFVFLKTVELQGWIEEKFLKEEMQDERERSIKYICPKCHAAEMIPSKIIEYFDSLDTERLLIGPATFRCKKCGYDYMQTEH